MKQLVLARYKENIDWIKQSNCPSIIIYNKDEMPTFGVPLPNIGREAHTYIYHIIANYHKLADVTIFSQANPFDHLPGENPISIYNNIPDDFTGFKAFCFAGGRETLRFYGNLLPGEDDRRELIGSHYFTRAIGGPKRIFEESTGLRCPDSILAHTNAQFVVSKDRIQKYSLHTYLKLMSYFFLPNADTVPYEFEYMWSTLFGEW